MKSSSPLRIGKYQLDHRIGAGGMGEVYLAHDTELERPVAIKLIRRERLEERDIRNLFRREAKATAKLHHPAIVRIYDFLRWQEHECLVMEYLEGQSFKTWLKGQGQVQPEVALPLFLDVADGLAHAHRRGILHRDLKPGNLWITPEKQIKILDFGLAKYLDQETTLLNGRVIGTHNYMSPQQARGEKLDHRSDLFSLGIIFYQTLTATHPFEGASAQETLASIRAGRQEPASDKSKTVPLEISQLVDRMLAKNPSNRPSSADEVVEVVAGVLGESRPRRPFFGRHLWAGPWTRAPKWIAAAALLVSVTLMWIGSLAVGHYFSPQGPSLETGQQARPSLVVLGRAEQDWVVAAIAEILSAHLDADDAFYVLPSSHSAYIPSPQALTQDALTHLRKVLRVDHFVLSECRVVDDTWQVRLQLVDARRGKIQAETSVTVTASTESAFLDEVEMLLEEAATTLRGALGHEALATEDLQTARATFPDGVAGHFYAQGLAAEQGGEPRVALDFFVEAIANDPDAPMPYAAQAVVLTALGELDAAAKAGARAIQRSEVLSAAQQRQIGAFNAAFAEDWQSAANFHQANVEAFPDVLRYGRGLAEALYYLDDAGAALDRLGELERLSRSLLDDGRLDLLAAYLALRLGDLPSAEAAALRAVEIGETLAFPQLYAEAQIVLSMTLSLLGQKDGARRAWETARIAAAQTGNRLILLNAFHQNVDGLFRGGQIAEALRQFDRHRNLYREAGKPADEARMAYNLGTALMDRDLEAATVLLSDARAISNDLGLQGQSAAAEFSLGAVAQLRGRLDIARVHYQIALDSFTEQNQQVFRAAVLTSLGEIAFFATDFEKALDLHTQALEINRALPYPAGVAYDTFRIAETLRHQGELERANEHYRTSLEAREGLGDMVGAAEIRIGLARLDLARKNFGSALTHCQTASRNLLDVGSMDLFVLAQITEAWIHLAQGEEETTRSMLDEIELHAEQSIDRRVGFEKRLLAAHIEQDSAALEHLARDATPGGDLLYANLAMRSLEN